MKRNLFPVLMCSIWVWASNCVMWVVHIETGSLSPAVMKCSFFLFIRADSDMEKLVSVQSCCKYTRIMENLLVNLSAKSLLIHSLWSSVKTKNMLVNCIRACRTGPSYQASVACLCHFTVGRGAAYSSVRAAPLIIYFFRHRDAYLNPVKGL